VPEYHANLQGEGRRFALVVSRFNEMITTRLRAAAVDCLTRHGVALEDIHVVWVPGAMEIPLVAYKLAATGSFDAVVTLGAVIRGATPHFDHVAGQVTRGVSQAALSTGVPVVYGIITADTLDQAAERAGAKSGNRGWDAALSALEMAGVGEVIAELDAGD
jgi:6,7-dimethyl-8-ribityllumazine synthase